MIDDTMKFDGVTEAPSSPQNNLSNFPRIGTTEWEERVAEEQAAREAAGSGVNVARMQVLAAEKEAGDKTRAELAANHGTQRATAESVAANSEALTRPA